MSGIGGPAVLEGRRDIDNVVVDDEEDKKGDYPMDFYADQSLGDWTPRHGLGVRRAGGEKGRPVPKSKRQQASSTSATPQSIPVA